MWQSLSLSLWSSNNKVKLSSTSGATARALSNHKALRRRAGRAGRTIISTSNRFSWRYPTSVLILLFITSPVLPWVPCPCSHPDSLGTARVYIYIRYLDSRSRASSPGFSLVRCFQSSPSLKVKHLGQVIGRRCRKITQDCCANTASLFAPLSNSIRIGLKKWTLLYMDVPRPRRIFIQPDPTDICSLLSSKYRRAKGLACGIYGISE